MMEIADGGAHALAQRLLLGIAINEKMPVYNGIVTADKQWILSTLAEIYNTINQSGRRVP